MIQQILLRNKVLFWLGAIHLFIFTVLLIFAPFNEVVVLGVNSVIKPMKFALSIWIYSWTMAMILYYVEDDKKVKIYSWVAVIAMCFEQFAITSQALRGQLSHFNRTDAYGIIMFSLMGVFILTITLWTAYITYVFMKQKTYVIPQVIVLSIQIGLVYFVVFSLFGGYISSKPGHTVGATDGSEGLWFINWSKLFGDLRVAHFFGIHSLQLIPLFGILAEKYLPFDSQIKSVWLMSILYLVFVVGVMIQGIMGLPFVKF
jgi:hypothetical protein